MSGILAWITRPNTPFLKATLDLGYIDLDGQYWGVPTEGGHASLLENGFRMSRIYPFQVGWVHIGQRTDTFENWRVFKDDQPGQLNNKQIATLISIGFNPKDSCADRNKEITFESAFKNGYSQHKLPSGINCPSQPPVPPQP